MCAPHRAMHTRIINLITIKHSTYLAATMHEALHSIPKIEKEIKMKRGTWAWWSTPVILALGRSRKDNQEFEVILDYLETSYTA